MVWLLIGVCRILVSNPTQRVSRQVPVFSIDWLIWFHRNSWAQQRVGRDTSYGPRRWSRYHPGDANARHQAPLALGRDPGRHARAGHTHAVTRNTVPRNSFTRHSVTRNTGHAPHTRFYTWRSEYSKFISILLIILMFDEILRFWLFV